MGGYSGYKIIYPHRVLLALLFLLLSNGSLCDEQGNEQRETVVGEASEEGRKPMFDRGRDYIGEKYVDLVHSLDMFVSRTTYERERNDSHLSLIIGNTWFEDGSTSSDVRLRTKVDFPGTERRFRLFIETDPDETRLLRDRTRPVSSDQSLDTKDSVAGIEYAKDSKLEEWKHSISLGGKWDDGIKPLLRYRVRRYWKLGPLWTAGFRQDLWHQDGIGWGETSYSEFTRAIGDRAWLQVQTSVELRDDDSSLEYVHNWRLNHDLTDRWSFAYRASFLGDGPLSDLLDDRAISTSISYFWEDRAIGLHLIPEWYFAEENRYETEFSLTLQCRIRMTP